MDTHGSSTGRAHGAAWRGTHVGGLRPGWLLALVLAGLPGAGCGSSPAVGASSVPRHVATTPVPNAGRADRTALLLERAARTPAARLVFLGDSITEEWEDAGAEVWARRYATRDALGLGVGADRTENVLHRLELGQLDGLAPRVVVLMIGTNNTGVGQTPGQIADGVAAILGQLAERLPDARVLLLAIFPRGAEPSDPLRRNNDAANVLLAGLADGERVVFLDIGSSFLDADGRLPPEVMPDLLHLSPQGYALWAEAMEPTLVGMLGG